MGGKTLTNAHCLLELIEKAPVPVLRAFAALPECVALEHGFDWSQDAETLPAALTHHIRHLRKNQLDLAEREALRVLRLASELGARILRTVAERFNDNDLFGIFLAQDGGEIGRSIWMRTHSDDSALLFDAAESILNTHDIRGTKTLFDAFDVPCEDAPPFIWNETVKRELEKQLTQAMGLVEPCDVVYVPYVDEDRPGGNRTTHFLVVRYAGDQVTAVKVLGRNRQTFWYFPARDSTLVYSPERKAVEVFAPTISTRGTLANVLSKHGFRAPLSNRPLNRARYDLSRFALPLKDEKPRLDGAKVERLYLTEAKALLGHATDVVALHLESGAELHDVMAERWGDHPFAQPGAIVGVTLVAHLLFDGEAKETLLSITLAEPGRCSLQSEKNPRLRQAGDQLLDALGVRKPVQTGSGIDDPELVLQVSRLLEFATGPMDGFALAQLGIDIDQFHDEGILTEGERITEKVFELAEGERLKVKLERCTDTGQVRFRDPLTGDDWLLPDRHARRWKIDLRWLREKIITALGSVLKGAHGRHLDDEPVFLGELEMEGQSVALYFATRMASERNYARIDTALRLRPRPVAGIVLTTSSKPFPFAGTNVVIPVEAVLSSGTANMAIDPERLQIEYRNGRVAANGGSAIHLQIGDDGYSAVLYVPGKAPWSVTSKAKVLVLQRLVDAHQTGTHMSTKHLMADTGYLSPANLFPKTSPWRNYMKRVDGAHAWKLNTSPHECQMET